MKKEICNKSIKNFTYYFINVKYLYMFICLTSTREFKEILISIY